MPQVKCPKCGTVRLVVEGKTKKCRKCGTPLTANIQKPVEQKTEAPKVITAEELQKQYPQQVDCLIDTAQKQLLVERVEDIKKTTVEVEAKTREEIGNMKVEIFAEQFPKLFNEIAKAVKRQMKQADKG